MEGYVHLFLGAHCARDEEERIVEDVYPTLLKFV